MIQQFRNITIMTMLALLSTLCVWSPAWAADYRSVRGEGINVRSGPGTDKDVLFQLPNGYPLKVLSTEGTWLMVEDCDGEKGWIAASVVSTNPTVIVKGAMINLRSGPTTNDSIVGSAAKGTILTKVGQQGEWIKVSHPHLTGTAWVSKGLIWP